MAACFSSTYVTSYQITMRLTPEHSYLQIYGSFLFVYPNTAFVSLNPSTY
jgi:hypothetical protein